SAGINWCRTMPTSIFMIPLMGNGMVTFTATEVWPKRQKVICLKVPFTCPGRNGIVNNYSRIYYSMKRYNLIMVLVAICSTVSAQFSLHPFFSDHMVWQRDQPVSIWGKGKPGTKLRLQFGGQQRSTQIGSDSNWRVQLAPLPLNRKAETLRVSGSGKTIFVKDILVGDVFLCFG